MKECGNETKKGREPSVYYEQVMNKTETHRAMEGVPTGTVPAGEREMGQVL